MTAFQGSSTHLPSVTCPRCKCAGLVQVIRFAANRWQDADTIASCAACGADLHIVTFADLGTTHGD